MLRRFSHIPARNKNDENMKKLRVYWQMDTDRLSALMWSCEQGVIVKLSTVDLKGLC